jgi:hypothetical protein
LLVAVIKDAHQVGVE